MPTLERLALAQAALELALTGADPTEIDRTAEALREALFEVREIGVWRATPSLAKQIAELLERLETSKQHVKDLTGAVRMRLAGNRAALPCGATYLRSGNLTTLI